MLNFLFKDIYAAITTFLVIGLMTYSLLALRSSKDKDWGRRVAGFIVLGTIVSATSAMRDAYASPNALFAMNSLQSNLCSLAGMSIFVIGVLTIFVRKQSTRRQFFTLITLLFIFQVIVIESSRILIGMGG